MLCGFDIKLFTAFMFYRYQRKLVFEEDVSQYLRNHVTNLRLKYLFFF